MGNCVGLWVSLRPQVNAYASIVFLRYVNFSVELVLVTAEAVLNSVCVIISQLNSSPFGSILLCCPSRWWSCRIVKSVKFWIGVFLVILGLLALAHVLTSVEQAIRHADVLFHELIYRLCWWGVQGLSIFLSLLKIRNWILRKQLCAFGIFQKCGIDKLLLLIWKIILLSVPLSVKSKSA